MQKSKKQKSKTDQRKTKKETPPDLEKKSRTHIGPFDYKWHRLASGRK